MIIMAGLSGTATLIAGVFVTGNRAPRSPARAVGNTRPLRGDLARPGSGTVIPPGRATGGIVTIASAVAPIQRKPELPGQTSS